MSDDLPVAPDDLATATNSRGPSLQRVPRALVNVGVFSKRAPGTRFHGL